MNVAEAFIRQSRRDPAKPAIVAGGHTVTFGALADRSAALAAHYREQGLDRGDVVLLAHGVGIDLYATLISLFRIGCPALLPDASAGLGGLRHALSAVPAKGLASGWKLRIARWLVSDLRGIPLVVPSSTTVPPASDACEDLPEDWPALITFTSGSTGRPKGIRRSHAFLMKQHQLVSEMLSAEESDVDLISLPVFVLTNLGSGVTSVIPDGDLRRPADLDGAAMARQIKEYGVTRILAPPALLENLCGMGGELPTLRKIFTGGGPVFPDLMSRLQSLAPAAEITAVYGSTEAEPIAHICRHDISEADFAAMAAGGGLLAGRPVDQIALRLIDDEITVSGGHVVKGYIDPADDAETKIEIDGDIWHRTGDAGRLDDTGRLWLLGRVSAGRGGRYPFALETAARSVPGVKEAAALLDGAPEKLVVSLHPGAIRDDVLGQLEANLPDVWISVVGAIPMDKRHNSKVDYGRLNDLLRSSEHAPRPTTQ